MPTITTMINVLYASLQPLHHGISLDDAADIFDKWLEEGHAMTDFFAVIVEIFKVSGLMPKGDKSEKN
jgi:hypothetical protein